MLHLTFIQLLHELLASQGLDASSWEIRSLEEVESTNDRTKELLEHYQRVVILSKVQTKGRGREGRNWYSPLGGIWLSVGVDDQLIMEELSTPVTQTVHQVLSQYVECEIKPPNDILISGRKVCGVLVEGKVKGEKLERVICGIGINYSNDFPVEIAETATRLVDHEGELPGKFVLAAEVAVAVIEKLNNYIE